MPRNDDATSRPSRRSIRLRGYDYRSVGAYFVTIGTYQGAPLFGEVVDGCVRLTDCGAVVWEVWQALPEHFPHVAIDAFVAMPDPVHGVLVFQQRGGEGPPVSSLKMPAVAPGSLGAVVRSFKAAATQRINEVRGTPGARVWHRNYYEHVVRDARAMAAIRRYIVENPRRWAR